MTTSSSTGPARAATRERITKETSIRISLDVDGPTGTVQLQFEANVTRFSDLAREAQLPERFD